MNVALFAPPGTITKWREVTLVWLLVTVTETPFAGAVPVNVTVPVNVPPPMTLEGLKLILESWSGSIARAALKAVVA